MALKRNTCRVVYTHAKPALTARSWFRVLKSRKGQSAYQVFVPELVICSKEKSKICGVFQMYFCAEKSGFVHHARRCRF